MATREALPDRKKITRICIIQTILFAIQGAMEVAKLLVTLNYYKWKCEYKIWIYIVEYGRVIVQQLCMILFALVVLLCLNAYKKALKEIRDNINKRRAVFVLLK
uniref:Uncharacterized protein n=1 Tax=Acrobeloides nanus TaxID=290746 RepID=A0A914CSS5_9BILA